MIKRLFVFIFILTKISASGQEYLFSLNRDMETRVGAWINSDTTGFHNSAKPYPINELKAIAPVDSIFTARVSNCKFNSTWLGRKLRKEHFIDVNKDDLLLSIDPIFNTQVGRDTKGKKNVFVNTRGVLVQGNYLNKFFFYTGFRENQANYVDYVDKFIGKYQVVPGQGKVKFLQNGGYDFSQSFGGIGYSLNRHFDFLFAHDKNFVGEGYRSLLISDNSYNYPFLRVNMTFWKFRYSVIYSVMRDLTSAHDPDIGYNKKYSTTHYLDINIGKKNKLNLGIFETVMFKPASSRGYELAYLNPMIFIRPVENSLDSPDNELLGLNAKWKLNKSNTIYGQLMLDELLLSEVRQGNGWWGNKQAFQLGYKSWNIFRVSNLNIQGEFNFARPYTYQHRSSEQNYTHYNQALAHPLGANFTEVLGFLNYRRSNWFAEIKVQYAQMGQDTAGINLGNDIFRDYDSRPYDYGHRLYDGLKTTLSSIDFRIDYLVNPKTNFNIEGGINIRKRNNALEEQSSMLFYFGLRTSLENFYFDF